MKTLLLFTDGSVNAKTKIGFGAFLAVFDSKVPLDALHSQIQVRQFENTSSTRLELLTLLWAMNQALVSHATETLHIIIHTDSQNIVSLPARRATLEQQDFYARNGKRLTNTELYQEFYRVMDSCNAEIQKIAGHSATQTKNETEKIFSLVDKAARSAMREDQSHNGTIKTT